MSDKFRRRANWTVVFLVAHAIPMQAQSGESMTPAMEDAAGKMPAVESMSEAELRAAVEHAEDIEPSFDCLKGILEVQADPLLGWGAFGSVHYAVLIAEGKTVALKAVSKAATRFAAVEGGSPATLHEVLFGEAQLLEEVKKQ